MTLWKFTKSLRSSCLEPRVLSTSGFAHALTNQLKWQLMRDNKNFMTGILPSSYINLLALKPFQQRNTQKRFFTTNRYAQQHRSNNLFEPGYFVTTKTVQNNTGFNLNGLLLISKVKNYSETNYSETRMFYSSKNVSGSSSVVPEKKDTGDTIKDQTKDSPPIGNNPQAKTETANNAQSKKGMLKQAVKDYGSTVIVFHVAMSLCSLGLFYLLVSSGLDMVELLKKIGVGEGILQSKITQGASTFVIAYAVHKVFAPVRITITLTATPLIVRKLRAVGILKKPIQK